MVRIKNSLDRQAENEKTEYNPLFDDTIRLVRKNNGLVIESEKKVVAPKNNPLPALEVLDKKSKIPESKEQVLTKEEKKQRAAILKARELSNQNIKSPAEGYLVPIEPVAPAMQNSAPEAANFNASTETLIKPEVENWEPKTKEEQEQYAAILKIRQLLEQDVSLPVQKIEQKKPEVFRPISQEVVITNEKTVENTEGTASAQYLLIKKLLQEDAPAQKVYETKTEPRANVKPQQAYNSNPLRGMQYLNLQSIIDAEPTKEIKVKEPEKTVDSKTQRLPFQMFKLDDLLKD